MEDKATSLCKHTMNELTANRRSMKSTSKNILDLMLPPLDGARACASSLSLRLLPFSVLPSTAYRRPSRHTRVVPVGETRS